MNSNTEEESVGVELPWQKIAPETLTRLLEEFVTRQQGDPTGEMSLDARVGEVHGLLRRGLAMVLFDPDSDSFSVAMRE